MCLHVVPFARAAGGGAGAGDVLPCEVGYAGDTNTGYDPAGHELVVVDGNLQEEEATPEQLAPLHRIVPVRPRHWEIPAEPIASDREFADASCPRERLYESLAEFPAELAAR